MLCSQLSTTSLMEDESDSEALGPVSENWFEEKSERKSKNRPNVPLSQKSPLNCQAGRFFPYVSTPGSGQKFAPSLLNVLRSQEESPIPSTLSWLQPSLGESPGSPDLTGKSSGLSTLCLDNSVLSWTSSMATPPIPCTADLMLRLQKSIPKVSNIDNRNSSPNTTFYDSYNRPQDENRFKINQKILARALFSPTEKNSCLDSSELDNSTDEIIRKRLEQSSSSLDNNLPDSCVDIFDDSFSVSKDTTDKTRGNEASSFIISPQVTNDITAVKEFNNAPNIKGDYIEPVAPVGEVNNGFDKLEYPTCAGDYKDKCIHPQDDGNQGEVCKLSSDDGTKCLKKCEFAQKQALIPSSTVEPANSSIRSNVGEDKPCLLSSPLATSNFQFGSQKRKADESSVYAALSEFFDSPPSTAAKRRQAPLKSKKRKSMDDAEINLQITSRDGFALSVGSSESVSLSQSVEYSTSSPKIHSILLSDEKQKTNSASKKVRFADKSVILQSDGSCFQDDVKSQSDGNFRTKRKRIKMSKKLKIRCRSDEINGEGDVEFPLIRKCATLEINNDNKNNISNGEGLQENYSDEIKFGNSLQSSVSLTEGLKVQCSPVYNRNSNSDFVVGLDAHCVDVCPASNCKIDSLKDICENTLKQNNLTRKKIYISAEDTITSLDRCQVNKLPLHVSPDNKNEFVASLVTYPSNDCKVALNGKDSDRIQDEKYKTDICQRSCGEATASCKQIDNTYSEPVQNGRISPSEDLFSQLSPTTSESSQQYSTLGRISPNEDLFSQDSPPTLETSQNSTPGRISPSEDLFSQVSPTTLETMCDVSHPKLSSRLNREDEEYASESKLAANMKSKCGVEIKLKNQDFNENKHKMVVSMKNKMSINCKMGKSKAKRFLYPSTNQIHNVSAEKVYNFKTESKKNTPTENKSLLEVTFESEAAEETPVKQSRNDEVRERKFFHSQVGFQKFTSLVANKKSEEMRVKKCINITHNKHGTSESEMNEKMSEPSVKTIEETSVSPSLYKLPDSEVHSKQLLPANSAQCKSFQSSSTAPKISETYVEEVPVMDTGKQLIGNSTTSHHRASSPHQMSHSNYGLSSSDGFKDLTELLDDLVQSKKRITEKKQMLAEAHCKSMTDLRDGIINSNKSICEKDMGHGMKHQTKSVSTSASRESACQFLIENGVTEQNMRKSAKAFSTSNDSSGSCMKTTTTTTKYNMSCSSGFQTANGKGICIPDEKILEGKAFFKDIDAESHTLISSENFCEKNVEPTESIQILSSSELGEVLNDRSMYHKHPDGNSMLLNNKQTDDTLSCAVPVTQKNMDQEKNLLKVSKSENPSLIIQPHGYNSVEMPSFQTGRGKPMVISEDKLTTMEKFFDDVPNGEVKLSNMKGDSSSLGSINEHVSENPAGITAVIDSSCNTPITKTRTSSGGSNLRSFMNSNFQGFQTAVGNKISVSEENILKGREFLDASFDGNTDTCPSDQRMVTGDSESPSMVKFGSNGFQTAGGKTFSVSAAKLEKMEKLLNEDFKLNNPSKCDSLLTGESVALPKHMHGVDQFTCDEEKVKKSDRNVFNKESFDSITNPLRKAKVDNRPKGFRPFKPPKITSKARLQEKVRVKQNFDDLKKEESNALQHKEKKDSAANGCVKSAENRMHIFDRILCGEMDLSPQNDEISLNSSAGNSLSVNDDELKNMTEPKYDENLKTVITKLGYQAGCDFQSNFEHVTVTLKPDSACYNLLGDDKLSQLEIKTKLLEGNVQNSSAVMEAEPHTLELDMPSQIFTDYIDEDSNELNKSPPCSQDGETLSPVNENSKDEEFPSASVEFSKVVSLLKMPSDKTDPEQTKCALSPLAVHKVKTDKMNTSGSCDKGFGRTDISSENLLRSKNITSMRMKDGCAGSDANTNQMITSGFFQTASGAAVTVSAESLRKSKELMNETVETETSTNENNMSALTNNNRRASLLQTASGIDIKPSGESLMKTKQMFNPISITMADSMARIVHSDKDRVKETLEMEDAGQIGNLSPPVKKPKAGSFFQTASGASVNVSEESIRKSKQLFEESFEMENRPTAEKRSQSNRGFYDKNSVSLTDDVSRPMNNNFGKETSHGCFFQTASGNSVNISEASLHAGKKILDSIDTFDANVSSSEKMTVNEAEFDFLPEEMGQTGARESRYQSVETYEHNSEKKVLEKSALSEKQFIQPQDSIKHNKEDDTHKCMKNLQAMFDDDFDLPSTSPKTGNKNCRTSNKHNFRAVTTVPEDFLCDTKVRLGRKLEPLRTNETGQTSRSLTPSSRTEIVPVERVSIPKKPTFTTPYKPTITVITGEVREPSPSGTVKKINPVFLNPYKDAPHSQTNVNQKRGQHREDDHVTSKQPVFSPSCEMPGPQVCESSLKERVAQCRKIQDEKISEKKRSKVHPVDGRMLVEKRSRKGYSLRSMSSARQHRSNFKNEVSPAALRVRSQNAASFKFRLCDFFTQETSHVLLGDCAYMVPDDEGQVGREEFYRAFLTIAGVDPKLVSEEWIYNHYRWIVWKLAAYEVSFPSKFGGRALTPDMVMLQLKYRYDREIDTCHRSALKKILERDDTPCKRMVLCVAGINTHLKDESNQEKKQIVEQTLELTDGWYKINAVLDPQLTDLVRQQKLIVGDKIVVSGAELIGSQDGCDPLEVPDSLLLKVAANSIRPVRWDAKLGYQRDPQPLCVPLSSLSAGGGAVGCVDVVIARIYPIMYMEKIGDMTIFRTKMAEEKEQQVFQRKKEDRVEKIYNKVQANIEEEDLLERKSKGRKKWTRKAVEQLQNGDEIHSAIKNAAQPEIIQGYLDDAQINSLLYYQQKVNEEKQQQLQRMVQDKLKEQEEEFPERNVTPLMKFRIVGCSRKDLDLKQSMLLSIWRPTPELFSLEEGKRYMIYSLNASASRSRHGGSVVQLTASKQTRFKPITIDENFLDLVYETREVQTVSDLKYRLPMFGEFDFVGMVVRITHTEYADSGKTMDTLYCIDSEDGFLQVKFWSGLKSYCLEDVLCEGKLFCAANLLWKSSNSWLPQAEALNDITHVTLSPSNSSQRKEFDKLQQRLKERNYFNFAVEKLDSIFTRKEHNTRRDSLSENSCQVRPMDGIPPVLQSSSMEPTTPVSEKKSQMHAVAQSKLSKLMAYGSPSALSPLPTESSRRMQKPFKTPLLKTRLNLD